MNGMYMRFPGGKEKAFTLSYDDGVYQDRRLLDVVRAHDLKCSFYLNSGRFSINGKKFAPDEHQKMSRDDAREFYGDSGMEVGMHGLTHAMYEALPDNLCIEEIARDRANLEGLFDCLVRGMAYPSGSVTQSAVAAARMCGILYARTVQSTHTFELPSDWLRLNPTCHHTEPELMDLAEQFLAAQQPHNPLMFYVWGHAWEYEEQNNWDILERLCDAVAGRDEIWYATSAEIASYATAFKRLEFSMDRTIVRNPTSYELWFHVDGHVYGVKAGQTLRLAHPYASLEALGKGE